MQASIGARGGGGEATLAFPISGFTLKRLGRIRVRRLPMLGQRFLRTSTHTSKEGKERGRRAGSPSRTRSILLLFASSVNSPSSRISTNNTLIRLLSTEARQAKMVERALSQAGPSFSSTRHEDQRDETTSTTTTRGA